MTTKTLKILAAGAPAATIEQGREAAQRVFDAAGITPWQAACAAFDREGWEIKRFPDNQPPPETFAHAEVWEEAIAAARGVVSAGGSRDFDFEMIVDDDASG